MRSGELQIIRNEDFNRYPKLKKGTTKRKIYFRNFLIFIILSLSIFGGIFFIKEKFNSYKSMEDNLNFQKQKIIEERMIMEKTLKEGNDKLYSLKEEYRIKNEELTKSLNEVKIQEEKLNSELKKVEELKSILKEQLVDMYKLNIDKMYDSEEPNESSLETNSTVGNDDTTDNPIYTGIIAGDVNENDTLNEDNEKILGIAKANWFIDLDSLGEFSY